MTNIQKQFFELLRAGLWNRPADAGFFEQVETDWNAIYQLARRQTVLGIVYDGIGTLPATLHPPRSLYLQWVAQVSKIEEANRHLDEVATGLFSLYKRASITAVLLKGQGVAINYPHPEHRQPGDIDIFVGNTNYASANNLLTSEGGHKHPSGTYKHTSFSYQGVEIENHRLVAMLRNPISDRYFRKMSEKTLPHQASIVTLSGTGEVMVPPTTFNALFLIVHIVTHFISGGVGLRQMCDWARLMHVHAANIDRNELKNMLSKTKYKRPYGAFAAIAVDYLGLPEEASPIILTDADRRHTSILIDDILQMGNFGQHNDRADRNKVGYWQTRWRNYKQSIKRCWQFRFISPSETGWYAITTVIIWTGLQWKKLWKKNKNKEALN